MSRMNLSVFVLVVLLFCPGGDPALRGVDAFLVHATGSSEARSLGPPSWSLPPEPRRKAYAPITKQPAASALHAEDNHRRMGELTESEERVYGIMQSLHDSRYPFRIVVVGNGAILESTTELGPTVKVSQSPKTGKNLMTLATEDQSFEFHLQLADVAKMAIVERETPKRVMRLMRLLNESGDSMCSLILADDSDAAAKWYHGMVEKYGSEVALS